MLTVQVLEVDDHDVVRRAICSLPSADDLIRIAYSCDPARRILVVTDVNSEQVVQDCLAAGVRGWIFKSDAIDDLTPAVEELQRNKPAFSKLVSDLGNTLLVDPLLNVFK